jgi:6,7-dimethyl-8-ribityllumazine synthase
MSQYKIIEGDFNPGNARFVIVSARFNSFIVDSLESSAIDTLQRHGVNAKQITVVKVPGAYELPLVCKKLAKSGNYEAVIALGAVIRGSTAHFDFVAGEAAGGLGQVALSEELPVIFGVLTTETIEQAIERAGTKAGNKGAEAALTAIELCSLLRKISS